MSEDRNKYIVYINDNIDELKLNFRKEILQMIIYSMESGKILEKGNGTQVKFADIDLPLLKNIYNYVYKKLESPNHQII